MNPLIVVFLTEEEVEDLHRVALEEFGGGLPGTRDGGLLSSAVASPQASFGGEFMFEDLFEMAAALLWHIARNHAFVDGNKRTATASALVFLALNGVEIEPTGHGLLYEITLAAAEGKATQEEVAEALRRAYRASN